MPLPLSFLNLPDEISLPFHSVVQNALGQWIHLFRVIPWIEETPLAAVTPNDPQFNNLWHLKGTYGTNVQEVWNDYRGGGITIGFVDDGTQYTHPDLDDNYNTAIDFDISSGTPDGAPRTTSDNHGTTTAGVAGAEGDNGTGVTGVAYEADIATWRLDFSSDYSDEQFASFYTKQLEAGVDVSNNSWGFTGFFEDDFDHTLPLMGAAFQDFAASGRGGLGGNLVFASGNGRADGQNTNYHSADNSQYVIAVAATDANGKVTSFSTPGASVLVSAPGANMTSTDRTGAPGYVSGDYVSGLSGTSYAAPAVSGVVALMLDANPNLGYRDVQEILAYSSRNSDPSNGGWLTNGASNWNGGGLHFSHDYGFGLVDARAAVRLAETWQGSATFANRDMVDAGLSSVGAAITDNNAGGVSRSVGVASDIVIDRVEVDVDITHPWIGDLIVKLISPTGVTSTLVNRPGVTTGWFGGSGSSADNIDFTLSSNAFWGETGNGNWTITVSDNRGGNVGTFNDWHLRLYGDTDTADDVYVYTDEFSESRAANTARGTLSDSGGIDVINLAAVTTNTVLSLAGGASTVDGAALTLAAGTVIETAYLGDGNDMVTGNGENNTVAGGRGNDTLSGGAGDDSLDGGAEADSAMYAGAFANYAITIVNATTLTVQDTVGGDGLDTLANVEKLVFSGETYGFIGGVILPPAANLPPVAGDDSAVLNQDTSVVINVLANDSDANGGMLFVSTITDAPDHGGVTVNGNNTITYTPTAGFVGTDSFAYQIGDGQGGFDTATVNLTVNYVAPTPQNYNGICSFCFLGLCIFVSFFYVLLILSFCLSLSLCRFH
ncbi:MAG: S8 family serine peptidase, partial [Alphaproteobacteria bacterium]|nr:S8 family serine peptidase [Alphaproteobacteria bacterium]